MKAALPLSKTKGFLSGLYAQAGKILSREFNDYQSSYAVYKTHFERAVFILQISVDEQSRINGLFIKPFVEDTLPQMKRNISKLQLPFTKEWTVFWGGDTKAQNYHVDHRAQMHAFDFVIIGKNGKSYRTSGENNEDYYAFGEAILSPCDGEVVMAVDGIEDNRPGQMNPLFVTGNTVIIKSPNNEFLLFAHFKQNTIKVKQGQKVKTGQLLGECGNSGNSSEAHLHFHIQNGKDMNVATALKCYFENIMVNGVQKNDYSPVKGDKIKQN